MALTPMMRQYMQVKENYKDCILFFRLGDFYEMFFDDAEVAARELELVLTGRDCGLEKKAPMCGIPYHAANSYISRLVNRGYKIAICEQLEDPSLAKGIVRRDVVKIVTPGTLTDSNFLEETKNNFLMSIFEKDDYYGFSFVDISTGEFYGSEFRGDINSLLNEISKFTPSEVVILDSFAKDALAEINSRFSLTITTISSDELEMEQQIINITEQFKEIDVGNFNITLLKAISIMLYYINKTQKQGLSNITTFSYYDIVDFLGIDINSRRNLELTESLIEKRKKGSLLWVLDRTKTAMGGRKLRKWVEQPLIDKNKIQERLDSIEELTSNLSVLDELRDYLHNIYDIERMIGKISNGSINAKELITLKSSLENIPNIKNTMQKLNSKMLQELQINLDTLDDIKKLIFNAILPNPALSVKEGGIINDGYDGEVDEHRSSKLNGKKWLSSMEIREKEETGIKSLKVKYNRVFGYYIEVTKTNLDLVPLDRYVRKQTLSNAERYVTSELKEMEEKILGAEEKLNNREYEIFVSIRDTIEKEINRLKKSADIISTIDCISSLAIVALQNNYIKPQLNTEGFLDIKNGRHPVVEKVIERESFVSNNSFMDVNNNHLLVITGPNMAGKSTYMRQVALITIMAQIGSFIPATEANISICDKIFTRIGASDDLAGGKSTFMVEMWEVSNILKNATKNSLVILDEVGRGTSTYDGMSIAWSVIEYICQNENLKCKTLFATHYHELTSLEGKIKGVKNYSIAVKKIDGQIVFLRTIVSGSADDSYGIEVAKLAGIPNDVIDRAREILTSLEEEKSINRDATKYLVKENKISSKEDNNIKQLDFSDMGKKNLIEEISDIDIFNLTPMDGFNKLYEIIKKAKELKE
ncbi:DNA mismatch repair protein MutS [Clostridium sp. DL1XJH146]